MAIVVSCLCRMQPVLDNSGRDCNSRPSKYLHDHIIFQWTEYLCKHMLKHSLISPRRKNGNTQYPTYV